MCRTVPVVLLSSVALAAATLVAAPGSASGAAPPPTPTSAPATVADPPDRWDAFHHWHRNPDGTTTEEIYAQPHFRPAGASWQPLDLRVQPSGDGRSAFVVPGAALPVRFGRSADALIDLPIGDAHVVVSAPGFEAANPTVQSGSIVYRNVQQDTDLRYRVLPTGVKEALILHSPSAPSTFRFHVSDPVGRLGEPVRTADGYTFSGLLPNGTALHIPAAFAYPLTSADAEPPMIARDPRSATLTIAGAGDGWDVSVSANRDWLAQQTFPVALDPSVTFDHPSGTMLAGFDSYTPRGCGGCLTPNTVSSDLGAGTYTDATYDWEPGRSFLQFDVSSIPSGSAISSASLGLYLIGCEGNPSGGPYLCNNHGYTVELHSLTGAWNTDSTWDQLAAITNPATFQSQSLPAFQASPQPPCTGCHWMTFDLTNPVQGWVNDPATNHGFVMKTATENYNDGGPGWSYLGPQGAGYGNPQPYLQVTYTANAPSALEMLGGSNASELAYQCSTGAPINCASGELWHTYDDLTVPGRGPSLDFTRTYNSLTTATASALGYGWTYSYGMSISFDSSGNPTVTQENGAQVPFTNTNGTYSAPPRVLATLIHNPDGTYTFTRRARERVTFSSAGKLSRIADLNGNTTALTYDSNSRLTSVADSAGRTLTLAYLADGHLGSVTDPIGRVVGYSYEAGGNLATVTDAAGGVTRFSYDANHNLLTTTDARGGVVTNTYDAQNRVTAQTDQLNRRTTFSYGSTTTTITSPAGNVEVESYQNGLLRSLTRGSGSSAAATWNYTYGTPTLGMTAVIDPNGHITSYTYDSHGNRISRTDGLGRRTSYTYDALNDLMSVTPPGSAGTTNTYDANGNLLSSSRTLVETGQTATTRLIYGDVTNPGRYTTITDATGRATTLAYDQYGNMIRSTNGAGDTTTYTYDLIGRLQQQVAPNGNVAGGNPSSFATTSTYNAFGDVLTTTDPLGHRLGYTYDANRDRTAVTDPAGNITRYTYDLAGQLSAVTNPDTSSRSFTYDGDGNTLSETDENGHTATYRFDALDRLTSRTDPANRTTSYTHDGVGNPTSITDSANTTITMFYDAADQLLTQQPTGASTDSFTYDLDGRRTREANGDVTRAVTYDSLGRLSSVTSTASRAGGIVGYQYDLAGRITQLTITPLDVIGNAITRTISRGYDTAGRWTSIDDGLGHQTTFGYDNNGNQIGTYYGNGTTATYQYDNADRLASIVDNNATGASFLTLPYERDANGNLLSDNQASIPAAPAASLRGYTYDNRKRLTSAVTSAVTSAYSYDAVGNLTTWNDPAVQRQLTYDVANQVAQERVMAAGQTGDTISFTYDARGDRTDERDNEGNGIKLDYNAYNRLVGYHGPAVTAIANHAPIGNIAQETFVYDSDGLRGDLLWDLSSGVPPVVADNLQNVYISGPDGLPVELVDRAGETLYYHHDQLGSTRALTDGTGTVAVAYTYDDYGRTTASTTNVVNPLQFAGQFTDAQSGLVYMRQRWYDPTTGQFVSRDPIEPATNAPYRYADDNPVNRLDPSGLCGIQTAAFRGGDADRACYLTVNRPPEVIDGYVHSQVEMICDPTRVQSAKIDAYLYRKHGTWFGMRWALTGNSPPDAWTTDVSHVVADVWGPCKRGTHRYRVEFQATIQDDFGGYHQSELRVGTDEPELTC